MHKTKNFWMRLSALVLLVAISSGLVSPQNSQAMISYVNSSVAAEKDFYLNGSYGKADTISANDLIETESTGVSIVMNDASIVDIHPQSSVRMIQLGAFPVMELLSGSLDVQTKNTVEVITAQEKAVLEQGAMEVEQTEEFAFFGNYYGSSHVNIYKADGKLALQYTLPLKKSIQVYKSSNKSNWDKIRYSKLRKELRLQAFEKEILRRGFSPKNYDAFLKSEAGSFLEKLLTFNSKRQQENEVHNFQAAFKEIYDAAKNKGVKKVERLMPTFATYKGLPQMVLLKNMLGDIQDPETRYTYEKELRKLFHENTDSIQTELKYLYSFLLEKDDKQKAFVYDLNEKIKNHTKLSLLEEDYYLMTAFIEAYPELVDRKTLNVKHTAEDALYAQLTQDSEKIDFLLSSFEDDLKIVSLLIENNNGSLAAAFYDKMLLDRTDFSHPTIDQYRQRYASLEHSVQTLLSFYREYLHSAAYDENIFQRYKREKEEEAAAEALFAQNTAELRQRPTATDFSSVSEELKKYSIKADAKNISYVLLGGKLLYVQNAELMPNVSERSFNFTYDPENKIISEMTWNLQVGEETSILPPLVEAIPLSAFQQSYNAQLEKLAASFEEKEVVEEEAISDWVLLAENPEEASLETAIKKRLTKEKLSLYGIKAKESLIKIYDNTAHVNSATIEYLDHEKKLTEGQVDLQINLNNWTLLGIQLTEFPDETVDTTSLGTAYEAAAYAHIAAMDKYAMQEEARSAFKVLNPLLDVDSFTVNENKENSLVFANIPFDVTIGENIETWYLTGEYDVVARQITSVQVFKDAQNRFSLRNYNVGAIQSAVRSFVDIDDVDSVEDAEEVIEDALSEEDMAEIREILGSL